MNWLSDNINLIALAAAVIIVILTIGVAGKYIKQMKTDEATGELAEDNWDGIGEYKNELPIGWSVSFLLTIIWAIWYWLSGYPLNAYSQIGEYNGEVKELNKKFIEKYKDADEETLKKMGKNLFLVQCAPCHGYDGMGMNGKAQDFTSRMSKEQVLAVIKNGQHQLKYPGGAMPANMLSGEAAEKVAEYVANGMQGKAPAEFATCAGCHGTDGKGMGGTFPNIKEYDETLVKHVLANGKKGIIGQMPAFNDGRLTDIQKKALALYIQSLNQGE